MIMYRINIIPCDTDGEGENWDEWYSSLAKAKKRRAELRRNPDYSYCGENYRVDRVTLPNLPKKKLVLKALNKTYFPCVEIVHVEPTEGSKIHLMPPSEDRADKRSVIPPGFARAFFEANR
jgi:hypothetical protein